MSNLDLSISNPIIRLQQIIQAIINMAHHNLNVNLYLGLLWYNKKSGLFSSLYSKKNRKSFGLLLSLIKNFEFGSQFFIFFDY